MKKFLFFAIISVSFLFSLTALTSCTKERIQSSIFPTDTPPKDLWRPEQIYLQTNIGFIQKKDFTMEKKGYFSAVWNGYQNYNAGTWYLVKIRKYYGMKDEITYVSSSFENAAVTSEIVLNIQERLNATGSVMLSIAASPLSNPLGADYTIFGLTQ